MNNSSSQGQLFYSQVTTPFTVYPVTTCDDAEGVSGQDAVAAAFPTTCNPQNQYCGRTAISNDMATTLSQTGQCVKNSPR
jgi:hypothetical protein